MADKKESDTMSVTPPTSTTDTNQSNAKNMMATSSSEVSNVGAGYHFSYCPPIYSGPDGMRHYRKNKLDPTFVGFSSRTIIGSLDTNHLTHDTPINPYPRRVSETVGSIGWGIKNKAAYDARLLKSGHQIQRKTFRQLKEDQLTRRPPFP